MISINNRVKYEIYRLRILNMHESVHINCAGIRYFCQIVLSSKVIYYNYNFIEQELISQRLNLTKLYVNN